MQKHAYLIMAHTDEDLLSILISMLDDQRNDIYVHLDKKWTDVNVSHFRTERAGLYILDRRIKGYWGHTSIMNIEYALYEAAYKHGGYAYYHLLSGADLPIKTQDEIHDFFTERESQPFVSYWTSMEARTDVYYKVSRYAFGMKYERRPELNRLLMIVLGKMRRVIADTLYALLGERKSSASFYKGANWTSLPEECVALLLDSRDAITQRLRWTRNCDEIFAQTILAEHYFVPKGLPIEKSTEDLRFANWGTDPNSPGVFRLADIGRIKQSKALFARKFSTRIDPGVIEWVRVTYSSGNE